MIGLAESYFVSTLAALQEETYTVEFAHGFHEHEKDILYVPAKLALIMSECAEALEWHRQGKNEDLPHELADIMIRTMNLAEGLKINLGKAILEKNEINKKREMKHGGKLY